MISTQRMAETVHRSVLAEISARRQVIAATPLPLVNGFVRDARKVADGWVQDIARQLQAARHHRAYDENTIRAHAENYATLCGRMASLESRQSFALHIGIEPPAGKRITREGAIARLDDPLYWRRQLRKVWTRASEDALREIGCIRKGKQPYASDAAVEHRAARARRTAEWLKSRVMVSEDGEQLELLQVAERSIANPAIRRTELMVRARGFKEAAEAAGHECDFWTLTTPSAFHAQHSAGGVNEAWTEADRPRVKAGQLWLCRMWARARAHIKRMGLQVYGIRTAEPHHDGTPHWHLQLFGSEAALQAAQFIIRQVWLSEYGEEKGAAEFRTKVIRIDPAKGDPVGYIAKYISKNIDGHGSVGDEESDETGGQVSEATGRVLAWARVHGIRQFQQYGGPPVGKWRELRRLREEVGPEDIEAARTAADKNSWHGYMQLASSVQLVRETARDGLTVRQVCSVNRYGEAQPPRVVGLRDWCGVVITRPVRWRIERKAPCNAANPHARGTGAQAHRKVSFSEFSRAARSGSGLGPVAITVRCQCRECETGDYSGTPLRAPSLGNPASWTARETSTAGPN